MLELVLMKARSLHAVLVSALAASACSSTNGGSNGSSGSSGTIRAGELTLPFDCSDGSASIAALRVALSVDYLAVRPSSERAEDGGAGAPRPDGTSAGTPCASATNMATCTEALRALASPHSQVLYGTCGGCPAGGAFLVFTRGDEVGKVTTQGELAALVGTVESEAEAWILTTTRGYQLSCKVPWIRRDDGGFVLPATQRISDCPIQTKDVLLRVEPDGRIEVLDEVTNPDTGACIGRRPAGLRAERRGKPARCSELGAYFARVARLEAASVDAFQILAEELAAHGAPARLVRACERAAADEVRHAEVTARLARRHGARPRAPRVVRGPVRSLVEIALENAVEGCVRETYGALEGLHQAAMAADPEVRAAMQRIARDESRHGALSWSIGEWLETRLTSEERRRVRAARDQEVDALTARVAATQPSAALVQSAGLPDAARAAKMAAELRKTLWAA